MTERSFVMVKPDGVAAGLTGEIISRIERRGLAILAVRKAVMARDVAEVHYGEHSERPFFGELVEFITSGPVVMMAVEGEGAVGALRIMMGPTDPQDAPPGTIRGDYALDVGQNVIHGSDGTDSAARELAALAGRTHVVRSAVCVITQRGEREVVDDARVTFRPLSEGAIDRYVATGEWRDRAGGYAIQGAGGALVERVEGDYTTVVGLPVDRLAALLDDLGLAAGDPGR